MAATRVKLINGQRRSSGGIEAPSADEGGGGKDSPVADDAGGGVTELSSLPLMA
jgi:hypothetical protein